MRKATIFYLMALISVTVFSQTRQGVVRTPQRPAARSVAVPDAVISMQGGNTVRSRYDGRFSVTRNAQMGNSFQVMNVTKKGYELFDRKVIGKRYDFGSRDDIELILIDSKQLQRERRQIEKKAEERALASYRQKYERLTRQYEQERVLTAEQYHRQLQELQDALDQYTSNISNTVDYYLHIDYQGMDEKDAEIARCMENAEYDRADSLIRTMFDPSTIVSQSQAADAELDDEESALLAQLEAVKQKKTRKKAQDEKNAEYLYHLFTIALAEFNNDSAYQYITQRAALDTTRVQWQDDAGHFIMDYLKQFDEAEKYFTRSMNIHKAQGVDGERGLIDDYDNLGFVYYEGSHYAADIPRERAIPLIEQALVISKRLLGENDPLTAEQYNNLGLLTRDRQLIRKAIEIMESQPGEPNPNLAVYYENYATMFLLPNGYGRQAMEYYILPALRIKKKAYGNESLEVAETYLRIGRLYTYQNDNYVIPKWWNNDPNSIFAFSDALSIYEQHYGQHHLKVAETHNLLGKCFISLSNAYNSKFIELAKEHLSIAMNIYQEYDNKTGIEIVQSEFAQASLDQIIDNHQAYDSNDSVANLVFCYKRLASLNYTHHRYRQSLALLHQAIAIELANNIIRSVAFENLALAKIYYALSEYTQADKCIDNALSLSDNNVMLAELSHLYEAYGDIDKALSYYSQFIELEHTSGHTYPEYDEHLGDIYAQAGNYPAAISCWQRALAIRSDHHGCTDSAHTTVGSCPDVNKIDTIDDEGFYSDEYQHLLKCYYRLGMLYARNGNHIQAQESINHALALQTKTLGANHYKIAECYDSLGMVHCYAGEFDTAKQLLDKALKIRNGATYDREIDKLLSLTDSDICFGKLYACMNDTAQALKHFRAAYHSRIRNAGRQSNLVAECWYLVGKLCEEHGKYEDALVCYDEAMNIISLNEYHDWYFNDDYSQIITLPNAEYFTLQRRINLIESILPNSDD